MIRVDDILVTKKNVFLLSGGRQYVADIESEKSASEMGDSVDANPWNLYTDDGTIISNLFDSGGFNVRTQITDGNTGVSPNNKNRHERFFMPSDGKYAGMCQVGDVGYSVSDKTNEKFRSHVRKYDMTDSEYAAGYGFCQYFPLSSMDTMDANFIDPNIVYTPDGGAQYVSEYPMGKFYSDFGDNDLDVEGSEIDVPTIYGDSFLTKYFYDGNYSVNGHSDGDGITFEGMRTYYGIGYNGDTLYMTYRNNCSTYSSKYGKYASRVSLSMVNSIRFDFDTVGLVQDCTVLTHHNADWSSISVYNSQEFESDNSLTELLGGNYYPIRSFEPEDKSFILLAALKKSDSITPSDIRGKKFNSFVYIPRRGGFEGAKAKDLLDGTANFENVSAITFAEMTDSVIVGMRNNGTLLALAESRAPVASSRLFPFVVPTFAANPYMSAETYSFVDSSGRSDVYYNGSDILAVKKYASGNDEATCRLFLSKELNASENMPIGKVFAAACSADTELSSITALSSIPYMMENTVPIFDYCPKENDIVTYTTKYTTNVSKYQTSRTIKTENVVETVADESVEQDDSRVKTLTLNVSAKETITHYGGSGCAYCGGGEKRTHLSTVPTVDNSMLYNGQNSLFLSNIGCGGEFKTITMTAEGPLTIWFSTYVCGKDGEKVDKYVKHCPKITVAVRNDAKKVYKNIFSSPFGSYTVRHGDGSIKWEDFSATTDMEGLLEIKMRCFCGETKAEYDGDTEKHKAIKAWLSNLYIVSERSDTADFIYGQGLDFSKESDTVIVKSPPPKPESVPLTSIEITESTVYDDHYKQIVSSEYAEARTAAIKGGNYVFAQFSNGVVGRSHVDDIFTNGMPIVKTVTCGPMNSCAESDRILTDIRFVSNGSAKSVRNAMSFTSFTEVRPTLMATYVRNDGTNGTVNSFSVLPLFGRTLPIMLPSDVSHTGSIVEYDGIRYPQLYEFYSGQPIEYSKGVTMRSFSPSGEMHGISAVLVDWDGVANDGTSTISHGLTSSDCSIGGLYLQYGAMCTELFVRIDNYGDTYGEDGKMLEGDYPVEARSGFAYPHPTYGDFATDGTGLLVFEGPFSNSMRLGDIMMLNNFLIVKNYSVETRPVTPEPSRTAVGKNTYSPSPKFPSGGYVVADMNAGGTYNTPSDLYELKFVHGTYYKDVPSKKFKVYPSSSRGTSWKPFYSGKTVDFIKYGNGYYYIVLHDSSGGYEVVETESLLTEKTCRRCESGKTVTNIRFFKGYTVFEYSADGEPYNVLYAPAGSIASADKFQIDGAGGSSERKLSSGTVSLGRFGATMVTYTPSSTMMYGGRSMTYIVGTPGANSAGNVAAVTEMSDYEYTSNAVIPSSIMMYSANMNGTYGTVYNNFPTTFSCNSEIESKDPAAPLSGLHPLFGKFILLTDDMHSAGSEVINGNGVMCKKQNSFEEASLISRNASGDVYEYESMDSGCYDFLGSATIGGSSFCAVFNRSNGKAYVSTDYVIGGTEYDCGTIFVEVSGTYDNAVFVDYYYSTDTSVLSGSRFRLHRSESVDVGGVITPSGNYYVFNPFDSVSGTMPTSSVGVTRLACEGSPFITDTTISYAAVLSGITVNNGTFFFGKDSVYVCNGTQYSKLGGYSGDVGEIIRPKTTNSSTKTRGGACFFSTSGDYRVLVGVTSSGLSPFVLGSTTHSDVKKTFDGNGNVRSLILYEDDRIRSYCDFETGSVTNYSRITKADVPEKIVLAARSTITEMSSYEFLDIDSNTGKYYGLVSEYNAKFSEVERTNFAIDGIVRTSSCDKWTVPSTSAYLPSSQVKEQFEDNGWMKNVSSISISGASPLFTISNIKKGTDGKYSELTLSFNSNFVRKNHKSVRVYRCSVSPWNINIEYKNDIWYTTNTSNVVTGPFDYSKWKEVDVKKYYYGISAEIGDVIELNGYYYESKERCTYYAATEVVDKCIAIYEYNALNKYESDNFISVPGTVPASTETTSKTYISTHVDTYLGPFGHSTCAIRTTTFDTVEFGSVGLAAINEDYDSVTDFTPETEANVKSIVCESAGAPNEPIGIIVKPVYTISKKHYHTVVEGYIYWYITEEDGSHYITYDEDEAFCKEHANVEERYSDGWTGDYDRYEKSSAINALNVTLKSSEGWTKKLYSYEYGYTNDEELYENPSLSVYAEPSGTQVVVDISFSCMVKSPYAKLYGRRKYVWDPTTATLSYSKKAYDFDTGTRDVVRKMRITTLSSIDTPATEALTSTTTFGLSSVGTLPTSSENRFMVAVADTLQSLCRQSVLSSVPATAGHMIGGSDYVDTSRSFIKTSDNIAICNLDGLVMLCGNPNVGSSTCMRVFPVSSYVTYDSAISNAAGAQNNYGDTVDIAPTMQQSDVVGYDSVETVYSINRFAPHNTHKSNLFSIRIDDLGIDESPYLSDSDKENVKQWVKMHVTEIVDGVKPANTELFDVILG